MGRESRLFASNQSDFLVSKFAHISFTSFDSESACIGIFCSHFWAFINFEWSLRWIHEFKNLNFCSQSPTVKKTKPCLYRFVAALRETTTFAPLFCTYLIFAKQDVNVTHSIVTFISLFFTDLDFLRTDEQTYPSHQKERSHIKKKVSLLLVLNSYIIKCSHSHHLKHNVLERWNATAIRHFLQRSYARAYLLTYSSHWLLRGENWCFCIIWQRYRATRKRKL